PHPVVLFLAEMLGAVLAQLTPGGEIIAGVLAVLEADDLRLLLAEQAEGPANRNNVHGHEQLVQHQDAGFQRRRGGAAYHILPSLRTGARRVSTALGSRPPLL